MATKVGFSNRGLRSRVTLKSTVEKCKNYVYNPDTGEILQRDPEKLGKVVIFYLAFYAGLAIFFTLLMSFTMWIVIDSNYPMRTGMANMQKENPGMAFRPLPDIKTPLIRFEQGVRSTYKIYTDNIQAFIDQYDNEKQVGEHFVDCDQNIRSSDDVNKVCRFNIDSLGSECTWQKDYGFDMGQPCVLLKLNMQYGWMPEPYNDDDAPPEIRVMRDIAGGGSDFITVTCEGENPMDKENIGNITMYPSHGLPRWYFPYLNQEGYRQPIVMARFENPMNGVVINVWCKAWAHNLRHHRHDMAASVHFEILID